MTLRFGLMPAFLSPEWVSALDAAGRAWPAPAGVNLTVQQVVRDGPDGSETRYHLVLEAGSLRVVAGPARSPSITITQSYEVAVALSRGEINAQQALVDGQLKISGEIDLLSRHARALAALDDLFAGVRADTTYG